MLILNLLGVVDVTVCASARHKQPGDGVVFAGFVADRERDRMARETRSAEYRH